MTQYRDTRYATKLTAGYWPASGKGWVKANLNQSLWNSRSSPLTIHYWFKRAVQNRGMNTEALAMQNEARTQRNMRLSCLALGITLVFVLISQNLPEVYQWYLFGVATSLLMLFGVMISPLWKDEQMPEQTAG